jgi:hypothetical protein
MTKLRPFAVVAGVLALMAGAVAPASAQQPGEVFRGEAAGAALDIRILGTRATIGGTSASVTSQPTAVSEGVGLAALAGGASRSQGNQDASPACLPLDVAGVLAARAACGDSRASLGGPTAEGTATVADATINLTALANSLGPVFTALNNLVCPAVPSTPVPTVPVVNIPLPQLGSTGCQNLLTGLQGAVGSPLNAKVGDSLARVTTDAGAVTAFGQAEGATLSLLNLPSIPGPGVACSGVPMIAIKIGRAQATAVYNRGAATSSSDFKAPIVEVDLCLITADPAPVSIEGTTQTFTLPVTNTHLLTVQAGSGERFTGSVGARARAVGLDILGGTISASVARAEAVVDGARPQVRGVEVQAPGDLPRTGSGMPPWTPVAGFAMLAVAFLAGRVVVKARSS